MPLINTNSSTANPVVINAVAHSSGSTSASSTAEENSHVVADAKQAQVKEQTDQNPPSEFTVKQQSKQQQNAAILQAHIDVNISAKNDPLSLLYRTALEALGKELEPTLGPNAIEQIQQNGPDHYTPEATAERIVQLSTGFFQQYQDLHKDQELEEQVDSFIALITGGVDQGFGEAREILGGLGVLEEGGIAENIDKTYDLIIQGYADFKERIVNPESEISTQAADTAEQELTKSAAASIASYRTISSNN